MRILIVSGIWPPDVGGPASHAPEVADALTERGHTIEVVTTASSPPESRSYPIRHVQRSLPRGIRHAAVAALVAQRSDDADVIYATSMVGRTMLVAGAPFVIKAAGDAAYERSLRKGLYNGQLDEFQTARLDLRAAVLRQWRTLTARRAAHILAPSEFLRHIVISWGVPEGRVSVLPNAAPSVPAVPSRDELRRSLGVDGPTLAFAGRLTRAKALEVALEAVAETEVTLLVVGDGEERASLERFAGERVRFLGALPRESVFGVLAAADAVLLSSSWENFPHVLVEGLAVGTPVIATRVGGVPEIVEHGVNGLLVAPGDPSALADAIRSFFADDGLRARLTSAAQPSIARFQPELILDVLEETLARAARN